MTQDSAAREPGTGDDGGLGGCRCDFAARSWHAEMLELEHDGTTVGWALRCLEEETGWTPADVAAFIHQHNWEDPASMDDLAQRFAFLAGRPDSPGERPSPGGIVSVTVYAVVRSLPGGDQPNR